MVALVQDCCLHTAPVVASPKNYASRNVLLSAWPPLWFPRFVARGAAGTVGGLLCAAVSALFLAYWFSAKEEVQGLKEVFQT